MACILRYCCPCLFYSTPTTPISSADPSSSKANADESRFCLSQENEATSLNLIASPLKSEDLSLPAFSPYSIAQIEKQPTPSQIIEPISENAAVAFQHEIAGKIEKLALADSLPGKPFLSAARLDNRRAHTPVPSIFSVVKVLVLDKNQHDLQQMQRILCRLGVRVVNITLVDNTQDAIKVLQSAQRSTKTERPFNIVFMDIHILATKTIYSNFKTHSLIGMIPENDSGLSSYTGRGIQATLPKPFRCQSVKALLLEHSLYDSFKESVV